MENSGPQREEVPADAATPADHPSRPPQLAVCSRTGFSLALCLEMGTVASQQREKGRWPTTQYWFCCSRDRPSKLEGWVCLQCVGGMRSSCTMGTAWGPPL